MIKFENFSVLDQFNLDWDYIVLDPVVIEFQEENVLSSFRP